MQLQEWAPAMDTQPLHHESVRFWWSLAGLASFLAFVVWVIAPRSPWVSTGIPDYCITSFVLDNGQVFLDAEGDPRSLPDCIPGEVVAQAQAIRYECIEETLPVTGDLLRVSTHYEIILCPEPSYSYLPAFLPLNRAMLTSKMLSEVTARIRRFGVTERVSQYVFKTPDRIIWDSVKRAAMLVLSLCIGAITLPCAFMALRASRKVRRHLRHQCSECGYPRPEDATNCPECGVALGSPARP
ncbi:MAG: hypothetical protein GC200_04570 [Tepidisphaera sp.]|nr:hypothetical protein [Tepidisphaera sp.]